MGQQVSKNIRSRLADSTLEELLVDDKVNLCGCIRGLSYAKWLQYIEELEGSIAQLPKQSQNNLARILASTGCQVDPPKDNRNCPTYRLRPLLALESADIGLSDDVAEALKQSYCNLIHQSATTNNVPLLAADFYEYTCKVETRRKVDKILWRFLTSFYYELVSELDDTKQRLSKTDKGSVAFVVAVICRPGKHDPLSVQEKVMDWVRIGRRYQGYMEALSPGCLIMFPDQISELMSVLLPIAKNMADFSSWEKYIPIKGDAFEKAVDFLRSLGIVSKCEEGGWNDLSLQILDTLRKPFQSFIPFQFRCNPKSQSNVASKRPPTSVICDADNRFLEQPVFGHKRTAAIRGKSPKTKSRRQTSDSRHDGGSRKRQRTGPSLVHPQPLVLPNDLVSRREHDTITTPKRQAHTKDQSREPLVDISTSATNGNNLNEYARTGSSFCESTGRRCLGANSIEAVLNHHNGPAARSTSARGSVPNPGSRRVSNGPGKCSEQLFVDDGF